MNNVITIFRSQDEDDTTRYSFYEPLDVCDGEGTPIFNANDYLYQFFGYCNAYNAEAQRQQTCEVEDVNDKIIRYLKRGKGRSSRSGKKSKSSKRGSKKW